MKKLEIELDFDGSSLSIVNEAEVIERCREMFPNGMLSGTIMDAWQWKSHAALGHFFGAIATEVHQLMKESGYKFSDKLQSVYYVLENLPGERGFGLSDKWTNISYGPNGQTVKRTAMPISGMGKSELHELANDLIQFLAEQGVVVPSVDEWKEKQKKK